MKTKTILIAEDDLFYRQTLCRHFEKSGFAVIAVTNGKDVLELLSENHVDLCIVDYHLPGKSGEEILTRLRLDYCGIPAIILTGDDSPETERNARAISPDFYFTKPVNLPDLDMVVDRILETSATA